MVRSSKTTSLSQLADEYYSPGDNARKPDHYLAVYEQHFAPLRSVSGLRLLELGVKTGASLALWDAYFDSAKIVGLDKRDRPESLPSGISFINGDQADPATLAEAISHGPFDIIVDDASHIGTLSRASFLGLFPHLKPGGAYVVEDYGTTFRPSWPDYRKTRPDRDKLESYCTGMMGFLKQVLDDLFVDHPNRQPVAKVEFHPGLAIIWKYPAGQQPLASISEQSLRPVRRSLLGRILGA